ncbi:MAG: tRNA (adenosine(37)-N6)-threonylcarbamoyltransferase complex dimerization subunit type 1 TsaB [Gammaproteobacteria bacterium]|nr:tRNA (adenosine(37)-N6)-threonylcarbamoyltransferase complex dimerization subunit type 1 TsaB [Gammaproteobacteria bacterium]
MGVVVEESVAVGQVAATKRLALLALDASTEACSAALLAGGETTVQFQIAPRQHGALMLPMIKTLLAERNLSLAQLDGLAFAGGPGRFTGLRIAAGVVQGLALSSQLPVIKVSTLAATAQAAWRQFCHNQVVVVDDARQQQLYVGVYRLNDAGLMEAVAEDALVAVDGFHFPYQGQWCAVGSAWQTVPQVANGFTTPPLRIEPCCYGSAEDVVKLAAPLLLAGHGCRAAEALPTYLRSQNSWRRLSDQQSAAGSR